MTKVEELRGAGKPLLEKFLDKLPSDATKTSYRIGIARFCFWLQVTPEELVALRKEQIADPEKEGEMQEFLQKYYYGAISEEGVEAPPIVHVFRNGRRKEEKSGPRRFSKNTAALTITAVREFLKSQGKAYATDFKVSSKQAPEPERSKYRFDRSQLQQILSASPLRDQVLFLFGASSGWGAGDIINLEKDVVQKIIDQPNGKRIHEFKRGKTNAKMYLCISSELDRKLRIYLPSIKSKWLFPGYSKNHITVAVPDAILKQVCDKLKISPITPDQVIRFHSLRMYFSYTAKNAGMSEPAVELAMGHELRYKGAYDEMPEEKVWDQFQKAEPDLTISVNVERNGLEKTVEAMQKQIEGLTAQLAESTNRSMEEIEGIERLKKENEELHKKIDELAKKP